MQVSIDSLRPTEWSDKSLKSVLPRLHVLAKEARFTVEIQTILNDRNVGAYDEFRAMLKDFPFASALGDARQWRTDRDQGREARRPREYGVFEGVNPGDTSRRCCAATSRGPGAGG
jgi:hypothetical protein